MKKKYETKIKDYTKDVEQNINQEAVVQTIKKCKKTFVKEKYVIFYSQNFSGFKKKDKWVTNVLTS